MTVLVCGWRYWQDNRQMWEELKKLKSNDRIIHGGCKGADQMAGRMAKTLGLEVWSFPADWHYWDENMRNPITGQCWVYHKAAGPIRNSNMLYFVKIDQVWAFHPDLPQSKGTKNMVEQARRADLLVRIFPPPRPE